MPPEYEREAERHREAERPNDMLDTESSQAEREQALDDKLKMLYAMIRAANPRLLDKHKEQGTASNGN